MYKKALLCLPIASLFILLSTKMLMPDYPHAYCPSPNYDNRSREVSKIIVHSTECPSTDAALDILTSRKSKVSCHYLICESGTIYRLVDDEKRAWHAGQSAWNNDKDINQCSIGIELDHRSPDEGSEEYPEEQITSLIHLLEELSHKHGVEPHNILAHSDIAPHRKRDPGNDFPWERLAEHGLGCWTAFKGVDEDIDINKEQAKKWLHEIGYRMGDFRAQIIAFQRHFLRHQVDGKLDAITYQRIEEILEEMVARRGNSS